MSSMKVLVGELTLTAPETVSESFECAAWHRTVVVAPGTYPVYAFVCWSDGGYRIHEIAAIGEGTVSSASFRSHFGGNAFGEDRGPKEVGSTKSAFIRLARYGRMTDTERLTPTLKPFVVIREWDTDLCGRMWRYEVAEGVKLNITTPQRERTVGAMVEAEVQP